MLYEAQPGRTRRGPSALLEVGSYCGRSTVWIGAGARHRRRGVRRRPSPRLGREPTGLGVARLDARRSGRRQDGHAAAFRRTIHDAGLEDEVVAVVGRSPIVAAHWRTPLAFCFIDGGHGVEPARRLRRLDPARRAGRLPGDSRRLPGSERGWASAVRADLPAGAGERTLPARIGDRVLRVLRRAD